MTICPRRQASAVGSNCFIRRVDSHEGCTCLESIDVEQPRTARSTPLSGSNCESERDTAHTTEHRQTSAVVVQVDAVGYSELSLLCKNTTLRICSNAHSKAVQRLVSTFRVRHQAVWMPALNEGDVADRLWVWQVTPLRSSGDTTTTGMRRRRCVPAIEEKHSSNDTLSALRQRQYHEIHGKMPGCPCRMESFRAPSCASKAGAKTRNNNLQMRSHLLDLQPSFDICYAIPMS